MPNAIKLGSRIARTQANGGITTGAIAVYPCHHANTSPVLLDASGNTNNGIAGGFFSSATAFASTAGILTTDAASTDTTQKLASFPYSFNAGDSLLIANRINITSALPGATKPIWAQGGNNSSAQGFSLRCKTTGALFWQLDGPSTSYFSADTNASGPAGNGLLTAAAWHHIVFGWWGHVVGTGANGTAYYGIWINGKMAFSEGTKTASSLSSVVTPVEAMRIGQYYRTAGPTTLSIGATQSSYHFYRAPQASIRTFDQMDGIAKRLYRDPETPLSLAEWPMV